MTMSTPASWTSQGTTRLAAATCAAQMHACMRSPALRNCLLLLLEHAQTHPAPYYERHNAHRHLCRYTAGTSAQCLFQAACGPFCMQQRLTSMKGSLIATTLTSLRSSVARSTRRPMRPKPAGQQQEDLGYTAVQQTGRQAGDRSAVGTRNSRRRCEGEYECTAAGKSTVALEG